MKKGRFQESLKYSLQLKIVLIISEVIRKIIPRNKADGNKKRPIQKKVNPIFSAVNIFFKIQ